MENITTQTFLFTLVTEFWQKVFIFVDGLVSEIPEISDALKPMFVYWVFLSRK